MKRALQRLRRSAAQLGLRSPDGRRAARGRRGRGRLGRQDRVHRPAHPRPDDVGTARHGWWGFRRAAAARGRGAAKAARRAAQDRGARHRQGASPRQRGLWDDASIAGDPNLQGGWFALVAAGRAARFRGALPGRVSPGAPPRLASLAFDSAALAAVLAKSGADKPFDRDAILNPSGFSGVDGLFRFTQAGLVQRGLAVIEIGPQGDTVVSPASTALRRRGRKRVKGLVRKKNIPA